MFHVNLHCRLLITYNFKNLTFANYSHIMTSTIRRYAAKGFTLIELLIVVIIIAILAAIAIPQFSTSSADAQEAAAVSNLNLMRSAVELYRVQHNGNYPSKTVGDAPAGCPTGGSSTATDLPTIFTEQLTRYSSPSGHTCSTQAGAYAFGPYMRAIPVEPVTNSPAVAVFATETAATASPPNTTTSVGWRFLNTTGVLQINSSKMARDGTTALSAK